MPEILLIHPPVYDFTAFDLFVYPLGLMHVAEALVEHGYHVDLIDALDRFADVPPSAGLRPPTFRKDGCGHFHRRQIPPPPHLSDIPRRYHRFGLPAEILKKRIAKREPPAAVAISCTMTYWYSGVLETVNLIRSLWPGVPVLLGGTYALLCPDHALTHIRADWVQTSRDLKPFLDFIESVTSRPAVPSVESDFSGHSLVQGRTTAAVQASTGCARRCPYCASHLLDGPYHARPQDEVVCEISELITQLGRTQIAFYDDALLHDHGTAFLALLSELRDRNLHKQAAFHCPNALSASAITLEAAMALKETHFRMIRIGFETADHSLQKELGGKATNEHLETALDNLKRAGFKNQEIGVYILAGLPGQSRESVERSLRFVHKAGGISRLAEFSPVPGTPLFTETARISRLDLTEPLNHNKTLAPFRFKDFTFEDVQGLKALAQQLNRSCLQS